jgi:phage terminase large subunit
MSRLGRLFDPFYREIRSDIFKFAEMGLNFSPTWQQAKAMQIVQNETYLPVDRRKKRIAIKSGQGPGKTTIANIIAWWRSFQDVDALTVVTAPSMRQCTDVFMAEGRRLLENADPMLKMVINIMNTRVEIAGRRTWGVWTATASRPENLQGYHQENLTFIEDESSGVPRAISEQIKGTLSNPNSLYMRIGNPNTTDCDFHSCFTTQRDQWHCLTMNAEETARDYPHIVHPSRNRAIELEYGRDSDVYRVRVLGEFPRQDPNSIMALDHVEACTRTNIVGCARILQVLPTSHTISLDFARYGSDESIIVRRSGLAVVEFKRFVKTDPREVVDAAFKMQHDAGWSNKNCHYIADAGGMGQGVMHSFHESGKNIYEFHTQGTPVDSSMYADQMSEAWFNLRTLVREGVCNLPNDARLLQQLSTRQYYTDRKGKLKVETKDEWKKRLGFDESPDRADAVVMAFYHGHGVRGHSATFDRRGGDVGRSLRKR